MDWSEIAKWLWGVLLIPVGMLWKKADGAATREELIRHIDGTSGNTQRVIDALKEHSAEDRETMKMLFANAESDRMQNNTRFSGMQDRIHDTHTALVTQINAAAQAANAASAAAAAVLEAHRRKP